jgi:hypothetical protein
MLMFNSDMPLLIGSMSIGIITGRVSAVVLCFSRFSGKAAEAVKLQRSSCSQVVRISSSPLGTACDIASGRL